MLTSPDFKERLNAFKSYDVKFLVVGCYAVMKYTEPHYTKDLDLWIAIDRENAEKVYGALKLFGAPLVGLSAEDFSHKGYFYQMGKPPLRVDIMMSIPGVVFDQAWERRVETEIEGIRIPFISRDDLIASKQAAGRAKDLADIERLNQSLDIEDL